LTDLESRVSELEEALSKHTFLVTDKSTVVGVDSGLAKAILAEAEKEK